MKGSREEIDKEDLKFYQLLLIRIKFIPNMLYELMSQSYSLKNQIFSTAHGKKF